MPLQGFPELGGSVRRDACLSSAAPVLGASSPARPADPGAGHDSDASKLRQAELPRRPGISCPPSITGDDGTLVFIHKPSAQTCSDMLRTFGQ